MSAQIITPEHVCYVHCTFCNTILAVSVPGNSLLNVVTVRCGHCTNLLSVNMGGLLQTTPIQDLQAAGSQDYRKECGSSSKCNRTSVMYPMQNDQQQTLPIRPPEKRQRVPSAYNRFIREEIQRIKASNPDISHREAFSAAAKNKFTNALLKSAQMHQNTANTAYLELTSVNGHIFLTSILGCIWMVTSK